MLSMKAKYALKALIVLTRNEKKMLQIKTIAKEADAPQKFLEAILLDLRKHGIVASKRGVFGGYFLSKSSEEVMVGSVIRIIDGPLAPIRCASMTAYQGCEDCTDEATCEIRKIMLEVRNAISGVLDKTSLKALTSGNSSLAPLVQ
jgi:Rrf2 family protein